MIRGAVEADRLGLGKVYCQSWKEAYRELLPPEFLRALTPEKSAPPEGKVSPDACVVWESDGEIIGLTHFGASRDSAKEHAGEIYSLYVLPEYWRKGIGRELFLAAKEALRDAGYDQMYLWVLRDNARARRFYERMGMRLAEEERSIDIAGAMLRESKYLYEFRRGPDETRESTF